MWLLLLVPTGAALGADGDTFEAATTGPRVSGTLPRFTDSRLREAFPLAVQRVRDVPECQELFIRLGADALEKLTTSVYYPATAHMENRVCRRGVAAFTYVGSPQVRLCRRFASLGPHQAAALLIHEALHWAGLNERPLGKDSLCASDIAGVVSTACDLRRGTERPSDHQRVAARSTGGSGSEERPNPRDITEASQSWDTEVVGLLFPPWPRSSQTAGSNPP